MSETVTVEELESQIELRKQRFGQVIEDIRALLRADLEAWFGRKTKRAFLSNPSAAQDLSKERVSALKRRAAELGKSEADRVHTELADAALWTAGGPEPDNRRDITAASAAWDRVRVAEKALHDLLDEFGLAGDEPMDYKPPAFFVNGLYMPSLAEHFWRLVHEMDQLRAQAQQLKDDAIREKLEAKWDEA